ncbi:Os02g0737300 [Oryza sativa Japonica Group]|jgi:hypothetical protein|uniref:Os02g0737300 protein n=8 Tax=Oryza TaxID=4527 RepID=A0A0P0VP71_ORYSJ|nr:hypothetical protein OsI_08857 [Oryza sativa Indica Group]EAZ24546.1 hypothetical protein OsJ_08308 [Oryza sativa Japonica Group]KAB8088816.1 hypothetical protein EE612_013544 [Oryza sativa]KAF2946862.1 hypothetical protein DAI22_02g326200 [Oryza sativa Japonica Group]BAD15909.1 hypothetical protein [Oryza sativa Japonica Group]
MAVLIRKLVLSLIVMVMVFLVVSGTAAARPLAGQEWAGEDTAGDDSVVVRFLRQLYLHKLAGPGHSCKTYSPNGGC